MAVLTSYIQDHFGSGFLFERFAGRIRIPQRRSAFSNLQEYWKYLGNKLLLLTAAGNTSEKIFFLLKILLQLLRMTV
jgi:hypothetical protein